MVDYVKYDMTDIWASSGDITAPSSGKIATGWVVEAVPRQWWNWFENRQDNNIAYMLQKGIPEWDAVTEYQTNKSYVQRNNVVYKCITANVNFDPSTNPLKWVKAFPESSASLEAIRVLTPAADRLAYFTSSSAAALTTLTTFARTLLDDVDAPTMRTTLAAQLAHANLTALSGVTGATNVLPYFDSASTMIGTPFTAFGRSIVDDADATAARTTLGLGTVATSNVTTSTLDNTAGRISKIGDFGENGGDPISQGSGVNANSLTVSGTYIFPSGGVNLPVASSFYLKHISYPTAGYAKQLAWSITTNTLYVRTQQSSSWSAWAEQWTTSNTSADVQTILSSANYAAIRTNLSLANKAEAGVNSDITSLSGLTTPLSLLQGGTGGTTATGTGAIVKAASPTLTGVPLSTTAAPGTNTTQIATTAFVAALAALRVEQGTGIGQTSNIVKIGWSAGSKLKATVDTTDLGNIALEPWVSTNYAPLASPTLTGTPLSTTAAPGTNTTQIATTAFVAASFAPKASPTFTGTVNAATITATGVVTGSGLTAGAGGISNSGTLANTGNINGTVNVSSYANTCIMADGSISVLPPAKNNANSGSIGFFAADGTTLRGAVYVNPSSQVVLQTGNSVAALTCGLTQSTFGHRVTGVDVVMTGRVYTGNGNSFLETDGNIVGSIWTGTGVLSTYLINTFITPANLGTTMAGMGGGGIGSYSLLLNKSGSGQSINTLLSGANIAYTDSSDVDLGAPPGTWRLMSGCNNLKSVVALRIS